MLYATMAVKNRRNLTNLRYRYKTQTLSILAHGFGTQGTWLSSRVRMRGQKNRQPCCHNRPRSVMTKVVCGSDIGAFS